ncbi:MAG TPA: hypothetical protein PK668_14655 [Myxococcota bacterium]|nr:hypothetical protein [Myxococcota bacterium]HRY93895.1 hypothetical protein [Myxococcota bacterium]
MTHAPRWAALSAFGLLAVASLQARAGMELNGVVATENYIGVRHGDFYNFRNANWFQLRIKANPAEEVAAIANLELRNTNFTDVRLVDDLWDRGTVEPVSWRVNEAYVDYYGFLLDNDWVKLDLRAGKQVLGWGEADGFNPTNPLDALDLENPLEFKARVGNVGLKAALTLGDEWVTLEGVVAPRYLPSVLPVDLFLGEDPLQSPLMPAFDLSALEDPNLSLVLLPPGAEQLRTLTPATQVDNLLGGARVRWTLWDFEWTVSYAHAREPVPSPRAVAGTATFRNPGDEGCPAGGPTCVVVAVDDVELAYPKIDVVGFNLRGALGDVGVWAEVALILPEGEETRITVASALGSRTQTLTAVEDEPYTKWVLGAEYTIPGGYYLNLQWIHGFFVEMTGHRLHDYLFVSFRKAVLNDRLRFELNLGGELDTTQGRDGLAGLLNALISYKPFDGSEVAIGYLMARGEDGTSLQLFEALDQLFLRFRADF